MQYENLQTQLQTLGDVNELEEARVRQNEVGLSRNALSECENTFIVCLR